MSNGVKRALPDSAPQPPLGVQAVGTVDPAQRIVVSVYLKAARSQEPVDLAALTARRAIELADDIEELRRFAAQYGLTVESVEPARRLVQLSGLDRPAPGGVWGRFSRPMRATKDSSSVTAVQFTCRSASADRDRSRCLGSTLDRSENLKSSLRLTPRPVICPTK